MSKMGTTQWYSGHSLALLIPVSRLYIDSCCDWTKLGGRLDHKTGTLALLSRCWTGNSLNDIGQVCECCRSSVRRVARTSLDPNLAHSFKRRKSFHTGPQEIWLFIYRIFELTWTLSCRFKVLVAGAGPNFAGDPRSFLGSAIRGRGRRRRFLDCSRMSRNSFTMC
jgi:hypothetical protein